MTTKTTTFDAISATNGGEFFSILGHVSKSDDSVKDRLLHATTSAIPRGIDLEAKRLDGMTALDAALLLAPHKIASDFASKALQVLIDRVKDRQQGNGGGGPSTVHVVARGANGGTILRVVSVRGSWALQAIGEQSKTWTRVEGNVDHDAENDRKFDKCVAAAQKQCVKWIATEAKRKADPSIKAQSISSVVALLGKCMDKVDPIVNNFRTLNLMGPGAITCDGIAIHGERFVNMLSVVAHFRPDLTGLLQSKAVSV